MIEFTNVTKCYENGTVGLHDATFKIGKGEFVFIVGPSGSGKSTLLKIMLHEELPTEGEAYVNGFNIEQMPRKEIPYLRRGLGVVFQDFRLLPNKNVYENVSYAMQVVEAHPRDVRRQVPVALALVGLSKKAKSCPNQLSGGEQQRVALARALVNNPAILIADEPTGNLDPHISWEIMKLLDEINQRGTTVVVATHEKGIVDDMKKRVICLEYGQIIHDVQKGNYTNED